MLFNGSTCNYKSQVHPICQGCYDELLDAEKRGELDDKLRFVCLLAYMRKESAIRKFAPLRALAGLLLSSVRVEGE